MFARVLTPFRSGVAALAISYVALVPLYEAYAWAFIKYWEWQTGRWMKFTLWAELRAAQTAVLTSVLIFLAVFQFLQRDVPNERRVPKWKVATLTLASMLLLSLGLFLWVWTPLF